MVVGVNGISPAIATKFLDELPPHPHGSACDVHGAVAIPIVLAIPARSFSGTLEGLSSSQASSLYLFLMVTSVTSATSATSRCFSCPRRGWRQCRLRRQRCPWGLFLRPAPSRCLPEDFYAPGLQPSASVEQPWATASRGVRMGSRDVSARWTRAASHEEGTVGSAL